MTSIASTLRLMKRYIRLSIRDNLQFPVEFVMSFFDMMFEMGELVLFWFSLFQLGILVGKWTGNQLMLFIAMNIFSGVVGRISRGFRDLEYRLLDGSFDSYLIRPTHPMLTLLLQNTNFFNGLLYLIVGLCFFLYLIFSGTVVVQHVLIGFGVLIFGTGAFQLLYGLFSLLAFWVGKIYTARSLIFSFQQANSYPLDVFPKSVLRFFTYVIPLSLMITVPTKILLGQYHQPIYFLGLSFLFFVVLFLIFQSVLKRALKHYQSTGS